MIALSGGYVMTMSVDTLDSAALVSHDVFTRLQSAPAGGVEQPGRKYSAWVLQSHHHGSRLPLPIQLGRVDKVDSQIT